MTVQSATPPRESEHDRGLILSMLVVAVIGIFLSLGWLIQNWKTLESASPTAAIQMPRTDYSNNHSNNYSNDRTQNPPTTATENPPLTEAQRIEQKLLNHPHVTPGRGFYKPGVQSTGNTIVDAVDNAKSSQN